MAQLHANADITFDHPAWEECPDYAGWYVAPLSAFETTLDDETSTDEAPAIEAREA